MRAICYAFRAALIKKWAEYRYYRWDFAVGLLIKLIFFLAMMVTIPAGSPEEAAVRLTGFVLWYFGAHLIAKMANLLIEEAYLGTLPQVLASRLSIWTFLGATAAAEVLLSSVWIAVLIGLALPITPLPAAGVVEGLFRWSSLAAGTAALLGLLGMALTIFGLSIEFKRAGSFAEVLIFFMLFFSGFFIPLDRVPPVLEALAAASPLYWFAGGMEQVLAGRPPWTPLAVLLGCSTAWLAAGVTLTGLLLRRAAVHGTLTRY